MSWDRKINVLVIGHSHVYAIREAAVLRRASGNDVIAVRTIHLLDPVFGDQPLSDEGGPACSPGLLAAIADQVVRHRPVIATAVGGNTHNVLALVERAPPLDFDLSGEPSPKLNPRAELRTEREVRDRLAAAMSADLSRLTLLSEVVGPFLQIESPPPVGSRTFIARRLESFFRADPDFERNGIAPGGVRYRMWRLASRIYAEHCRSLGCGYLPCPSLIRDESGFLDQRYAANSTHANSRYGEKVIEQIEDRLADGRSGWLSDPVHASSLAMP